MSTRTAARRRPPRWSPTAPRLGRGRVRVRVRASDRARVRVRVRVRVGVGVRVRVPLPLARGVQAVRRLLGRLHVALALRIALDEALALEQREAQRLQVVKVVRARVRARVS